MLISLQNEQTVHLTQRVNSKTAIFGLNRLSVDFTLKGDSKDLDFTLKRANCPLHAVRKIESGDFRPK